MPVLTFQGEVYSCARAQKGGDFVRLLDGDNNIIFFADGITDFSGYALAGGDWEAPAAVVSPAVGALATLSGSDVVLTLPGFVKVETGLLVTFKAPCDCSVVSALSINGDKYTVVDALALCVTGKGGAWTTGAALNVILDVENKRAYLQNNAGVKIATGSYEGTGTYGSSNPNSLQFDFEPKILIVTGTSDYGHICIMNCVPGSVGLSTYCKTGTATNYGEVKGVGVTEDSGGGIVKWNGGSASSQLNESGVTYNYTAIG